MATHMLGCSLGSALYSFQSIGSFQECLQVRVDGQAQAAIPATAVALDYYLNLPAQPSALVFLLDRPCPNFLSC